MTGCQAKVNIVLTLLNAFQCSRVFTFQRESTKQMDDTRLHLLIFVIWEKQSERDGKSEAGSLLQFFLSIDTTLFIH